MKTQKLSIFVYLSLFLLPFNSSANNSLSSMEFNFYGEEIALDYNPDMVFKFTISAKDNHIKKYYEKIEASGAANELITQLLAYQESLALSDYLYYKLVRKACGQIYKNVKTDKKEILYTIATWYCMTKSGYDTRLTNPALAALFLYVPSTDIVYGMSRLSIDGKHYYNLTAFYYQLDSRASALRINKFNPEPGGKAFTFKIKSLPDLTPALVEKQFRFEVADSLYTLDLLLDSNSMQIMKSYPRLRDVDYLRAPISKTAAASLLPQMQALIEGKSKKEAVEVITAFCRKVFKYKWDWDAYEDDRPMIADQLFFAPFSDHEDRCALFFYLVRELLDLPMIILSHFNNNLTVAVDLGEVVGQPIKYNDREYTICDPTTPGNSEKLGVYPNGFKGTQVTVVGEYEPGDENLQGF